MELKLDRHEVEDILLAWAEERFKGEFNAMKVNARYGTLDGVEFFKDAKPEPQA